MKSQFTKSASIILALLVGAWITLACESINFIMNHMIESSTATPQILIVHPTALPDTPTALPGTYVATLDLVDEKITNDCGGAEFCASTVQGTLKYFAPVSARILCIMRGEHIGYSDPVDVDANASGTVTLSATFGDKSKVADPTDWFQCNMDGEGVHLLVNKDQPHNEVEVMP
jgi:hypothetical protein